MSYFPGFFNRILKIKFNIYQYIFLLVIGLLAPAFVFAQESTELVDINQSIYFDVSPMDTSERWQSFIPTKTNLSSVSFRILNWNGGINFYLRIVDTVTSEELVNAIYPNVPTTTPTPGYTEWMNFNFTDVEVDPTHLHKIYYSRGVGSQFNIGYAPNNPYMPGAMSINSNYDLTFKTYYDQKFLDHNYDTDLDENYPDFNTVLSQTCITGNECKLFFSFNQLAIGYPMYLINYEDNSTPDNAIASTTVTATPFWQNKIIVPEPANEGTFKYNLLLDANLYGWIVDTGIAINWMSSSTWDDYISDQIGPIEEYCAEEVVCADVATSSDFLYGVQCGFQKTICWTFAPTEGSKKYLMGAIESYEKTFPNNLYFSFVDRLDYAIQEVSATESSIDIPYIDSEGMYFMLPVVTSSTVPNALGNSYNTVHDGLVHFVWIITGMFVLLIVWFAVWK